MSERPVVLQFPASSAYLAVARSATSAVCSRLDFPLDRLDEAALAVSEAAALLLKDAAVGARVRIELSSPARGPQELIARLSCPTRSGRLPRTTSFAWTVLSALADDLSAELVPDGVALDLRIGSRNRRTA